MEVPVSIDGKGYLQIVLLLTVAVACASTKEHRARSAHQEAARVRQEGRHVHQAPSSNTQEEDLDGAADRSAYRAFAALHNPELEAAFHRWSAMLETIPQARSLPNPKLTYALYIRHVETRVGPQRHRFGLAQAFPWFGTLTARADVATEASRAARAVYNAKKLALFSEVDRWYSEYAYLAKAISLTAENLELLRYLESVVRTRYSTGAAAHAHVIQLQVELGRLEDRLRALEDYRAPLSARLSAVLNRDDERLLPWPKRAVEREGLALDIEQLLAWLNEHNPELQRLDALASREEARVVVAQKQGWPSFAVGVDYIETGGASMSGVADSGKDPVMAMLSLSLPIWRGSIDAAVREATANKAAAVRDREGRKNTLRADLQLSLYRARDADRRLQLYRDSLIPKADQAFRVALSGFGSAQASFLDVIDAERSLLEFKLATARAVADHAIALAEIERIVGRDLPQGAGESSAPPRTHESGPATGASTGLGEPKGEKK
jgi:outer membrane protein, heavy metal efflux system